MIPKCPNLYIGNGKSWKWYGFRVERWKLKVTESIVQSVQTWYREWPWDILQVVWFHGVKDTATRRGFELYECLLVCRNVLSVLLAVTLALCYCLLTALALVVLERTLSSMFWSNKLRNSVRHCHSYFVVWLCLCDIVVFNFLCFSSHFVDVVNHETCIKRITRGVSN